jgi:hypothetical protein
VIDVEKACSAATMSAAAFGSQGLQTLARGIPSCIERGKSCLTARSLVGRPPFLDLVIPAAAELRAADADMSSPCGGMSVGSHVLLLCSVRAAICSRVRSDLPTA